MDSDNLPVRVSEVNVMNLVFIVRSRALQLGSQWVSDKYRLV